MPVDFAAPLKRWTSSDRGALVNTCAEDSEVLPGEGILRKGRYVLYREWAVRSRKE